MQKKPARERTHSDLSNSVDWGSSVSLDSERRLLGLMLARGDVFDLVGADVAPAQFYEPLHRQMFDLITASRSKGLMITSARLGDLLAIDSAYRAAGGRKYLDSVLQAAAVAEVEGVEPRELANLVVDLFVRREVIKAATDIAAGARGDGMLSGKDLRDMMEARLFQADMRHGEQGQLRSLAQIAKGAMENSKKGGSDLVSTGLKKLDERIGRCERGDLMLLAARPSMGKSALASCIALNAGLAYLGAIEFNGEMSEEQMARRHLSDMCHRLWDERGPTYREIRQGNLDAGHTGMLAEAERRFEPLPIMALRRRSMTLPFIRSTARRQAIAWKDKGIRLTYLIVDSINNLKVERRGWGGNRVDDMTEISDGLKSLAVDLDCIVVGLSQLSRKIEERDDKRPTLPDLRESGSLEQDADVVVGIYRDAYYAEREARPKKEHERTEWLDRRASTTLEAIVMKVKEGAPGTEKLHVDVARNAVRDNREWDTSIPTPGELPLAPPAQVNDGDEVPL